MVDQDKRYGDRRSSPGSSFVDSGGIPDGPTIAELSGAADVASIVQPFIRDAGLMLHGFRVNHPFVPVKPFPVTIRSIACDGANSIDVNVPDGAMAVEFTRSAAGNIYVSSRRLATLPAAWGAQGSDDIVCNPSGLFYCYGQRQFSVIGDAQAVLSCSFYVQSDTYPPAV